ncbi:MAG: hypothetical protein AB8H79_26190 [Myxococcota bacterium]
MLWWMLLVVGAQAETDPCFTSRGLPAMVVLPTDATGMWAFQGGVLPVLRPSSSDSCWVPKYRPPAFTMHPVEDPSDVRALSFEMRGETGLAWAPLDAAPGRYVLTQSHLDEAQPIEFEIREGAIPARTTAPDLQSVLLYNGGDDKVRWSFVTASTAAPSGGWSLIELASAANPQLILSAGFEDEGITSLPAGVTPEQAGDPACARARYLSAAGEPGPWSDVRCSTPETTTNAFTSGCQTSPAGSFAWLALPVLLGMRRRRGFR